MGYILYVVPDEAFADFYKTTANSYNAKAYADRDAGFDLFCGVADVLTNASGTRLDQNCVAAFYVKLRPIQASGRTIELV